MTDDREGFPLLENPRVAFMMRTARTLNLQKLPQCPLEARARLITWDAAERAGLAVDYIKNRYSQRTVFQDCMDFVCHDLIDSMRSDFESLGRVWYFPATEAADELSECVNRMFESSYKASRDNMRRALEVILVGAFFSHTHISPNEAKSWLNSKRETPYFVRTIKELAALPRFNLLNSQHDWVSEISRFYWNLCDTIHTKGKEHSLTELQPSHSVINSVRVPEFNEEALCRSLDLHAETVYNIGIILAAYNPALLVGLPLYEKFGDNPPLSGFFEESQSERLWRLIPQNYHSTFKQIAETDDDVTSVLEWMKALPDKF